MTEVHDAFKMPYQDKEPNDFVSFDKHHRKDEKHSKQEVFEHLYYEDEADTNENAVLGYD